MITPAGTTAYRKRRYIGAHHHAGIIWPAFRLDHQSKRRTNCRSEGSGHILIFIIEVRPHCSVVFEQALACRSLASSRLADCTTRNLAFPKDSLVSTSKMSKFRWAAAHRTRPILVAAAWLGDQNMDEPLGFCDGRECVDGIRGECGDQHRSQFYAQDFWNNRGDHHATPDATSTATLSTAQCGLLGDKTLEALGVPNRNERRQVVVKKGLTPCRSSRRRLALFAI
jgi:hypothetical protein